MGTDYAERRFKNLSEEQQKNVLEVIATEKTLCVEHQNIHLIHLKFLKSLMILYILYGVKALQNGNFLNDLKGEKMEIFEYLKEKHLQEDGEERILIWHDNGVPGQEGFTEYTASEIKKEGGMEALIDKYIAAGITIKRIG